MHDPIQKKNKKIIFVNLKVRIGVKPNKIRPEIKKIQRRMDYRK